MTKDILGKGYELIEDSIECGKVKDKETLYALGNGHFGTRGYIEEGYLDSTYIDNMGTYINGFYESNPITYGESAYGYAKNHQTICKVPNGANMSFSIDGEWFTLANGKVTDHNRIYDMKEGTLKRSFNWENSKGKKVHVEIEKLVSFDFSEIMMLSYKITPLNFHGNIHFHNELSSKVYFDHSNANDIDDPRVGNKNTKTIEIKDIEKDENIGLLVATKNSGLRVLCSVDEKVTGEVIKKEKKSEKESIQSDILVNAHKDETLVFEVIVGYGEIYTSENEDYERLAILSNRINEVKSLGFKEIKNRQLKSMDNFWKHSDIEIEGDNQLQLGLRFNLFHLNQAAGRDGLTNIAAKGLTGDGYEGHYFWDTEMYMLPLFVYTQPEVAKALLSYRHSILPKARIRAKELGVNKGILFPWRTINGEECSAYYPAGTAQVHINADIAYGVKLYFEATNDVEFMCEKGLEILIETARFWMEFGDFIEEKDNKFCINGVTGPDEYTAIVNNNFYTNLMAKHNLLFAVKGVEELKDREEVVNLFNKIGCDLSEVDMWKKASENMYLPYDDEKKLTMQDDTFFSKKVWDFENTPKENYPLLLHYHPLTIYRYQVNKQADTVLGQLMFSNEFSLEQKKRDFDYYEKITTHDSSLSRSIFGMMASEIGEKEKAYNYFMDTALMDLIDMQQNTKDGIHAANMGGTWMSIVYGFAGMKVNDGKLNINPRLPEKWSKVSFKITFKNKLIKITITELDTIYELIEGYEETIVHCGQEVTIKTNEIVKIENKAELE